MAAKTSDKKKTTTKAEEKKPAKKTSRRAVKKTTKKAPARRATQKKSPAAAKATVPNMDAAAKLARKIDLSKLATKTRLHAVAKMVGLPTKDVVALLAEKGITKVAQSSLTVVEVTEFIDQILESGSAAEFAEEEPQKAADKGLRKRVQNNVDNEIAQIEEKVEAELATAEAGEGEPESNEGKDEAPEKPASEDTKSSRKPSKRRAVKRARATEPEPAPELAQDEEEQAKLEQRVRKNVDNEIAQIEKKVDAQLADHDEEERDDDSRDDEESRDESRSKSRDEEERDDDSRDESYDEERYGDTGTVDVEQLHEALIEAGDDLDEDFLPAVTPKPEDDDDEGFEYAPIFIAPKETKPATKVKRRSSRKTNEPEQPQEPEQIEEPRGIRGSTRIEAQRRRRAELRERGRERQHIVTQAEFLARREEVDRKMVVREKERTDGLGLVTQVGVLEDDMLVEHFVTSETQSTMIGNIYLGRVQNVLPSMEAAFVDIGQDRNGVLYAGEINWRQMGLKGRSRKVEQAFKSGDQVLVQVAKDPIGHKGARLTTQISLAGRYLVYVPGGRSAGISRKLPAPERKRLKDILGRVVPDDGGAIIRTAAENVAEEAIAKDVRRLHGMWEELNARVKKEKSSKGAKPVTLYEEPDMLVKVVRDLFNEDFNELIVDGNRSYNTIKHYVDSVAPDLADRVFLYDPSEHANQDAFESFQIDEQLQKALSHKVWLPSGGTLVIDRTEAMTVIDVNTGKFTGSGGNLEETVTRNNLEAAEEIVRQMRLRDLGGMIVVDFIDMVLPENQDLVLRRLKEALGRDRTRHQVSEVTSLGLVQMTRKRLGTGLIETFATECEHCHGRGIIIHEYPVDESDNDHSRHKPRRQRKADVDPKKHPLVVSMQEKEAKPESSYEELADAVLSTEPAGSEAQQSSEDKRSSGDEQGSDEGSESKDSRRRSRRRRGSRGGSRGSSQRADNENETKREGTAQAAEPEAEATEHQVEDKPAKREGSRRRRVARVKTESVEQGSEQQSTQTYEEALAEFEASPRRKRQTRGNSRSDHAPKKEDFAPAKTSPEEPVAVAEETSETAPEARPKAKSGTRGRRRSVRKLTRKQEQAQALEQQAQEERKADNADKADTAAKAEPEAAEPTASTRPRRARKRVAKRPSRATAHTDQPQQPAQRQAPQEDQDSPSQAAETASRASAPGKRGRRRATRRRSN